MKKFGNGDVVRLKSGGPVMTVKAIYCSDSEGGMKMVFSRLKMTNPTSEVFVACQWFEENGELKEAIFEEEMLEKAVK